MTIKFDELFESKFQEKENDEINEGSYKDEKFSLSSEEISEIVTDADSKNKLDPEEKDALENDLEDLMDKIYKKYKGSLDGVEDFWKNAEKIGKKYKLVIKQ